MEEDAFANAAAPAVAMADKAYEPAVTSKIASGGGSTYVPAPGETTGVETGSPLSPGERAAIAERIRKLKIESDKKWDRCARTKSYDEVLTPLTCYQFVESHVDVSVDPRRNEEHRRSILSVLGIEPRHESLKHLSEKDIEGVSDLFWRKRGSFPLRNRPAHVPYSIPERHDCCERPRERIPHPSQRSRGENSAGTIGSRDSRGLLC